MRFSLPKVIGICFLFLSSFNQEGTVSNKVVPSPLAAYSPLWNDAKYLKANTAARCQYLSPAEKELVYVLNLARMNPSLFASTVVKQFPAKRGSLAMLQSPYYKSLLDTLPKIKAMALLQPDSLCFAGAECHAIQAGIEGYVGHTRSKKDCRDKWYFRGECCDYGHSDPLGIIMALLVDESVESLGHRKICLDRVYNKVGVSIQPHKMYTYNAVIDFY